MWIYCLVLITFLSGVQAAPSRPQVSVETRKQLVSLRDQLSVALLEENSTKIHELANESFRLLGENAGIPEVPDELRPLPEDVPVLSEAELSTAFDPYVPFIERQIWWKEGLDPTKTNHTLREVASVIEACLLASSVKEANQEKLLKIAKGGGDFLVWAQEQAGSGVFPFPAVRNGQGRPLEVAEAFLRRAEQEGKLGEIIVNGWVIEDFDDGGLQFDNGLAGVALIHLYEATGDETYLQAAKKSADWALNRRMVTNWNYNSFSVYLLSEAFRITGDVRYLESAKKKALLGVIPGQLTSGSLAGRWADPHNARPAYHYIMLRSLASLASVLPKDDPEDIKIITSLKLGLRARNPDFHRGIANADSSVDALILVVSLPDRFRSQLCDSFTEQSLEVLEQYGTLGFRLRKGYLGPKAWAQLVARRKSLTPLP